MTKFDEHYRVRDDVKHNYPIEEDYEDVKDTRLKDMKSHEDISKYPKEDYEYLKSQITSRDNT